MYNELTSAFSLFKLAEENTNLDIMNLLKDQYSGIDDTVEFIHNSKDIGQTGNFVQELLLLESKLHKEISDFNDLNTNF